MAVCDALERVVMDDLDYTRELHDFTMRAAEADASAASASAASSGWMTSRSRQASQRSTALRSALRDRLLADFLAPNARFHSKLRAELARPVAVVHARNVVPVGNNPAPQKAPGGEKAPSAPSSAEAAAQKQSAPTSPEKGTEAAAQPSAAAAAAAAPSAAAAAAAAPSASASVVPSLSLTAEMFESAADTSFPDSSADSSTPRTSRPSPFANLAGPELERAIRAAVDAQVRRVWQALELDEHYSAMAHQSLEQKEAALQKELEKTWDGLEF